MSFVLLHLRKSIIYIFFLSRVLVYIIFTRKIFDTYSNLRRNTRRFCAWNWYKNGKYYTCFSCQVEPSSQPKTGIQVGIDLGVKHLATTSDEQFLSAPKHLRKSESQIKRLQQSISKKKKGSKRRKKVVEVLARTHEKVANRRKDYAHKLSHLLVQAYDFIAFEDLSIPNMVKNHRLAKSIVDAGWGQLVQYTTYKAESASKRVVLVNPYQTSQRCSCCGKIVKKTLAERMHRCTCGYEQDRDINAAINILHLAQQVAAS
ncbi:RNA-guided endonuclease InsQ/TnpB family protein [Shimazuella kribbensis]|uniref:RNA-guided endonuclease InsQ/TnpB family protein n=1 Tax=Shimazuella kribbensis TaxID=139808 RepID=UPI0004115EE1|nr:RNA-guided endonuclease TnpB family protein [Shimazuella kribbensis]